MMQQSGDGNAGARTGSSTPMSDRLEQEKQDAKAAARDLRDDVADKASELAADAKAVAEEKVEHVQQGIGAELKSLSGALRSAGEHLSSEHRASASRVASEAASQLDHLSEALHNRSVSEVVGDLRDFGRRNAGGLFAGSVLAGLALGRLLQLSVKSDTSTAGSSTGKAERPRGETGDANANSFSREGSAGPRSSGDYGQPEAAPGVHDDPRETFVGVSDAPLAGGAR